MKDSDVILIVDDDEGHVALIKKNLKHAGVKNKTLSFQDGPALLNFLDQKERNAYILLLDINMPKISGIEVLERIKTSNELHSMPVIMFTTSDDTKSIRRCEELGCTDYIVKYIDYEKFVTAVRSLGTYLKELDVPPMFQ